MPPHYKLTYFNLNARAASIRMLFALADVPFEDHRIEMEDWPAFKPTTPFGTLPVLEVDGKELPQSLAILRYLSKEYGFYGETAEERAYIDALADQFADFTREFSAWHRVNTGRAEGDKAKLYEELFVPARAKTFPIFEKALKENKSGWLVGSSISFVDLIVASRMESLGRLVPEPEKLLEDFPLLKVHMAKVFAHPRVEAHLESRPPVTYNGGW